MERKLTEEEEEFGKRCIWAYLGIRPKEGESLIEHARRSLKCLEGEEEEK